MGRACSTHAEKRNSCGILVGKPEGKRPLGTLKRRWVDNIKKIIEFLNLIHCPVFYIKHNVSDTEFCFRPPFGPIDRAIPYLRTCDNIKMDLRCDGVVRTGLMWFRIETSGGLL
jgi:hypothetical protein